MATDISVTITPPAQKTVVIGNGITKHAVTHAPGGNDTLELYYATTGNLAYVSGQIGTPAGVVLITGDQNIGGLKNFTERPTVNGTGVLLSGEIVVTPTGYLTGYVNKTETGNFYPTSNPSGYITGVDLSPYSTVSQLTGTSGFLQGQITSLNNGTGAFLTTGAADNRYVSLLSSQTITGVKNFVSRPTVSGIGVLLSGEIAPAETGYLTGYVAKTETGNFYPTSNPSGYITGVDLTPYVTTVIFTGTSGYLQGQITTLNSSTGSYVTGIVVRPSDTGVLTGTFYPLLSNPSGYITGVDLSNYATITLVTGASGFLQSQVNSINNNTGSFLTTGAAYSQYVLQAETGQYTGQFYPLIENPSGYITGDLSLYATIDYTTGISGYLESLIQSETAGVAQVNGLTGSISIVGLGTNSVSLSGQNILVSGETGFLSSYVTGDVVRPSETGAFASTGYVSSVSGYLQSQISGSSFTSGQADLRYVGLTGDQVVSGVKDFFSRPTVSGIPVLLSGEIPTGSPIDAAMMLYNRWAYTGDGLVSGFSITGAASEEESSYRVTIDYLLQDPISYISDISSTTLYFYESPPSGSEIVIVEQDISGVISNYVNASYDQTITGVKNFTSRPTVNGTGVLLSGEGGGSASFSQILSNTLLRL